MVAGREELEAVVTARDQASRVFSKVEKSGKNMGATLGKTLGDIKVSTLAATASIVGLAKSLTNTIKEVDSLGKTANAIGVTTEALSSLEHAANISGASVSGLRTGIRILSRVLRDARNGLADSVLTLGDLGFAVKDFDGLALDQSFIKVADALGRIDDNSQKVALSMRVFGRSGADLINLANERVDGIRRLVDEAKRLGIAVSEKEAAAAAAAADALTRAEGRWRRFKINVVTGLEAIGIATKRAAQGITGEFSADEMDRIAKAQARQLEQLDKVFESFGRDTPADRVAEEQRKAAEAAKNLTETAREEAMEFVQMLTNMALTIPGFTEKLIQSGGASAEFAIHLEDVFRQIERFDDVDKVGGISDLDQKMLANAAAAEEQTAAMHDATAAMLEFREATAQSDEFAAALGQGMADFFADTEAGLHAIADEMESTGARIAEIGMAVADGVEGALNTVFDMIQRGKFDLGELLNMLLRFSAQRVAGGIGDSIASIFSADGNVFSGGRAQAFAQGGIIGGPTAFPLRGGMGVAGESGPEAIMPLQRDSSGRLGVSGGGGGGTMNVSIHAVDAKSFVKLASESPEALAAIVTNIVSRNPRMRDMMRGGLS